MATTVTGGSVPISPGKVYALGGTVSQNGDIHWVAEGRKGEAPLNAYLLVEGSKALVVDTSFPIVADAIVTQMRDFPIDELKIVFTRVVEFDSIGNADLLIERWPVSEIWSHFYSRDWVYFRTMEALPFPPPFKSKVFGADGEIRIGKSRVLETINAKLKLLNAAWGYDAASRTLFTSDSFSHVLAPAPGVRQVTEESDTTTSEDVLAHLRAKFRWMEGANTRPLREFVTQVFERFDVEHLAPSIGCVISGRELVLRHRDFVNKALRILDGRGGGHG